MKFSHDEINAIWSINAAVLHLGNVDFDESSFTDSERIQFNPLFNNSFISSYSLHDGEYGLF